MHDSASITHRVQKPWGTMVSLPARHPAIKTSRINAEQYNRFACRRPQSPLRLNMLQQHGASACLCHLEWRCATHFDCPAAFICSATPPVHRSNFRPLLLVLRLSMTGPVTLFHFPPPTPPALASHFQSISVAVQVPTVQVMVSDGLAVVASREPALLEACPPRGLAVSPPIRYGLGQGGQHKIRAPRREGPSLIRNAHIPRASLAACTSPKGPRPGLFEVVNMQARPRITPWGLSR